MALPHSLLWLPLLLNRQHLLLSALSRTCLLVNRQNLLTVLVKFALLFLTVDDLTRLGEIWICLSVADSERVQLAKLLLVLAVLVVVEVAKWICDLSSRAGEVIKGCWVEYVIYNWLLESSCRWSQILQMIVLMVEVAAALLYFLHLLLNPTELKVHPLDLAVVVFPQCLDLCAQLVDLFVLCLLAFDKNDGVIEWLLLKMDFKVFSQNLDLAPKVVVGALNKLEFALIFVWL